MFTSRLVCTLLQGGAPNGATIYGASSASAGSTFYMSGGQKDASTTYYRKIYRVKAPSGSGWGSWEEVADLASDHVHHVVAVVYEHEFDFPACP